MSASSITGTFSTTRTLAAGAAPATEGVSAAPPLITNDRLLVRAIWNILQVSSVVCQCRKCSLKAHLQSEQA
ncbi:MAG: hypothetical protein LLG20_21750 [Acidobacteriales bacterium]|nr:hypothetical protein [Terriglobales bacterium]